MDARYSDKPQRALKRIGPEGLALSEQLVLASMRAWAKARLAGEEPRGLVASGLTQVASLQVASAMIALMEHVERHARHSLAFHAVACSGYSGDEQRIVVASGIAAIAPDMAEELLGAVVRGPETCVIMARLLNGALEQAGYPLPSRLCAPADVTLH